MGQGLARLLHDPMLHMGAQPAGYGQTDLDGNAARSIVARAAKGQWGVGMNLLALALQNLVNEVEINTCRHEITKRVGAIFTICDECDRMWADDHGGFIPYAPSPALQNAYDALKLAEDVARAPNWKVSSDAAVAVSTDAHWQPMSTCPVGVKVQLLGRGGVAVYGTYTRGDPFWQGWGPLLKIPKTTSPNLL